MKSQIKTKNYMLANNQLTGVQFRWIYTQY